MNRKVDIDLILRREAVAARAQKRAIKLEPFSMREDAILTDDIIQMAQLDIQDIIPTLDAYTEVLPPGVQMIQNVVGNEVWPVSEDDVEMFEIDETDDTDAQNLSFANLVSEPHRVGVKVNISNEAIDNAAFDIVDYVQRKVQHAQRRYLAKHFYSFEPFAGNQGPWVNAQEVDITTDTATEILAELARMANEGFDMSKACVVMDVQTELVLKLTPIKSGAGRYIIENGLCMGYPYIVNRYFGMERDADGDWRSPNDGALGIGVFNWFAISQHTGGHIILEALSKADRNLTVFNVSTWWSMTNLMTAMRGESGGHPAFRRLVKPLKFLADRSGLIFITSDNFALQVPTK